jgi:hypothetical protein
MLHYKLPKPVRGATSRRLITNHGTIIVPVRQPDIIFEHNGNEAPVLEDMDSQGYVLNQFPVPFEKITIVGEEPKVEPEVPKPDFAIKPSDFDASKLSVEQKTIISQSVAPLVVPQGTTKTSADATFE